MPNSASSSGVAWVPPLRLEGLGRSPELEGSYRLKKIRRARVERTLVWPEDMGAWKTPNTETPSVLHYGKFHGQTMVKAIPRHVSEPMGRISTPSNYEGLRYNS